MCLIDKIKIKIFELDNCITIPQNRFFFSNDDIVYIYVQLNSIEHNETYLFKNKVDIQRINMVFKKNNLPKDCCFIYECIHVKLTQKIYNTTTTRFDSEYLLIKSIYCKGNESPGLVFIDSPENFCNIRFIPTFNIGTIYRDEFFIIKQNIPYNFNNIEFTGDTNSILNLSKSDSFSSLLNVKIVRDCNNVDYFELYRNNVFIDNLYIRTLNEYQFLQQRLPSTLKCKELNGKWIIES